MPSYTASSLLLPVEFCRRSVCLFICQSIHESWKMAHWIEMSFGWQLVGRVSLRNDADLLDMGPDPHNKAQILQEMGRRITYRKSVPWVTQYASVFNIYLNQAYMNHSLSFTLTLGRQQKCPPQVTVYLLNIYRPHIVSQRSHFTLQQGRFYAVVRSTSPSYGDSKISRCQNSQTPEPIDKNLAWVITSAMTPHVPKFTRSSAMAEGCETRNLATTKHPILK